MIKQFNEKREWTTDEILYIIYKNGGVAQLGYEANFVDNYFSEAIEKYPDKLNREELIEAMVQINQLMLEEIENYYSMGLTIVDVMKAEAAKYNTTVEDLFVPLFDKSQLH